jgi:hypothetical protein
MLPAGHISRSPVASTVAKWTTNLTHVRAEMLATFVVIVRDAFIPHLSLSVNKKQCAKEREVKKRK